MFSRCTALAPVASAKAVERLVDMAPLGLLAMGKRNGFQIFIGAHQREAKIRLPGIALRIELRQAAPDQLTEQRGDKRIN